MKLKWKFALTVASLFGFVIYMVAMCLLIIWFNLAPDEREALTHIAADNLSIIILFTFLLLAGLISILRRLFKVYRHTARLHEETQVIVNANPNHRVSSSDVPETRLLANTINAFADRYQDLQQNVDAKIRAARASVEKEKNILAALMSELSQGVVVCNLEGQILLYNSQARQLLGHLPVASLNGKENGNGNGASNGNGSAAAFVGLGRSIFSIIDRNLIAHTLDNLYLWLEQGVSHPVSHFITTNQQGRLIRVYIAPMQDQQRAFTGYVLTFEDTTQRLESSSRRDVLLQSLIERTRASLGNIRAAIEAIVDYPDMNRARLNSFTDIIHNESLHLSTQIEQITADSSQYLRTKWPLEDMLGADLITIIQRKVEQRLSVTARTNGVEENLWLKIDSFSLVQALVYIIGQLHDHFGIREVIFGLRKFDRFIQIDMTWTSAGGDTEMVRAWKQQPAITNGEGTPLTLTDVVERHEGEIWCLSEPETDRSYMRLLLPGVQPHLRQHIPVVRESRPEFYDFDLFRQAGQKPELDDSPLTELVYTVFDTETTGLNPSEGDEIISIGAVRIVNGRLLRQEVFDQLIDPRRQLSKDSIRIHGIEPDMLLGQPPIEQVLPRFSKFSEDTVLVAHNAAFDMRFLQIKEASTSVKFVNPVLDTLLLAAVINPNQEDHSIEAVARALGVNIIGRHTALGDAMVTGEVFLKLIALLKEQGIVTLKQAREAAQKTYYARLVY